MLSQDPKLISIVLDIKYARVYYCRDSYHNTSSFAHTYVGIVIEIYLFYDVFCQD